MTTYLCASRNQYIEEHRPEDCIHCLRAMRDAWRKHYETNVDVDLVKRLQEMDHRIRKQRGELARLNEKLVGQRVYVTAEQAFDAWVLPSLDRCDRRFASVAYRAGWQAARRALSMQDDDSALQPFEDHNGK